MCESICDFIQANQNRIIIWEGDTKDKQIKTIERKEKVQVEVQLPMFTKQSYHYYMVEETRTTVLFFGENDN